MLLLTDGPKGKDITRNKFRKGEKEKQKANQTNRNKTNHHTPLFKHTILPPHAQKGPEKNSLGYLTPNHSSLLLPFPTVVCRTGVHSSFKELEYHLLHDFVGKSIAMLQQSYYEKAFSDVNLESSPLQFKSITSHPIHYRDGEQIGLFRFCVFENCYIPLQCSFLRITAPICPILLRMSCFLDI